MRQSENLSESFTIINVRFYYKSMQYIIDVSLTSSHLRFMSQIKIRPKIAQDPPQCVNISQPFSPKKNALRLYTTMRRLGLFDTRGFLGSSGSKRTRPALLFPAAGGSGSVRCLDQRRAGNSSLREKLQQVA